MFKAIKEFFTGKPAPVETPAPVAEYKVEAPLVQLGPEPTPIAEQATQAVVESIAPAKKKPAAKKATAKKPRAPKAPKV